VLVFRRYDEAAVTLADIGKYDLQHAVFAQLIDLHLSSRAANADFDPAVLWRAFQPDPVAKQQVVNLFGAVAQVVNLRIRILGIAVCGHF
jgi:hypothetical protein